MPKKDPHDVIIHLGKCVLAARKKMRLSRRKLADLTGLSERFIQEIEKGQTNMSCLTLSILIDALQMPGGYLFEISNGEETLDIAYIEKALRKCSEREKRYIYKSMLNMIENLEELHEESEGILNDE